MTLGGGEVAAGRSWSAAGKGRERNRGCASDTRVRDVRQLCFWIDTEI